jgi:ABC-type branched-subunit amino acid transport system permease subunit
LLRKFQDAELLVFGAGMIVVLLFLPQGLVGLRSLWSRRGALR